MLLNMFKVVELDVEILEFVFVFVFVFKRLVVIDLDSFLDLCVLELLESGL